MNERLIGRLHEIAQGHQPSASETLMLARMLPEEEVQTTTIPITQKNSAEQTVKERCLLMQKSWPTFSSWWLQYFKGSTVKEVPIDMLWSFYVPLAQWIVEQKRRSRTRSCYCFGVYGSQGRGKTVTSLALVSVLNNLLDQDIEGQAVTRSIDDYYFSKARREALRQLGYDAGPGVSNRGPAGTHDTKWILRNINEFEISTSVSKTELGNFQKRTDDQAPEHFVAHGKVGVFILDGWFLGANTDFDISQIPVGFKKIVARHLHGDYKALFDRLDGLWAFDTPSLDEILRNREQQEQELEKSQGKRGMSPEQIRSFVEYFYDKPWAPGITSPIPHHKDITFLGTIWPNYRIETIERGGRPIG